MTNLTDEQRRNRTCTVTTRRAEDITPYAIVRWRGQWEEVYGVYRELEDWAAEFKLIADFGEGEDPGYMEQRRAAEAALAYDGVYVVLRLTDRDRSTPGEFEDQVARVYRYDLIEVQSLPRFEPRTEPATAGPKIWNTVVRVLHRDTEAPSDDAAVARIMQRLIAKGFDPIEGPGYTYARWGGDFELSVTATVVANIEADTGSQALGKLRAALIQAGYAPTAPRPGDVMESEGGTEVTQLPGD